MPFKPWPPSCIFYTYPADKVMLVQVLTAETVFQFKTVADQLGPLVWIFHSFFLPHTAILSKNQRQKNHPQWW